MFLRVHRAYMFEPDQQVLEYFDGFKEHKSDDVSKCVLVSRMDYSQTIFILFVQELYKISLQIKPRGTSWRM